MIEFAKIRQMGGNLLIIYSLYILHIYYHFIHAIYDKYMIIIKKKKLLVYAFKLFFSFCLMLNYFFFGPLTVFEQFKYTFSSKKKKQFKYTFVINSYKKYVTCFFNILEGK